MHHEGVLLPQNLTGVIEHFAARVPHSRTVFVAGYRVDLMALDEFRDVWDNVYALALYDWNGAGLQGRQFSSVINRLICERAQHVVFLEERVERSGQCW